MTDSPAPQGTDWLPPLKDVIRGSVHETRNALNGVVVNLEVVRSRLARAAGDAGAGTGQEVLSFAEQAAAQAESAARLNEGLGALLTLITSSFADDGRMRCATIADDKSAIRFDVDSATAERLLPRLVALGTAAGFGAERHDGTVIFSIPETSNGESHKLE